MSGTKLKRLALAATIASVGLAAPLGAPAVKAEGEHADKQFYPLFTYRTGPYANVGKSLIAGNIDLLNYLNETEGGVNGVYNLMVECETSYEIEKGIECYDRYVKGYQGAPTATIAGHSSGLFSATEERDRINKVPHLSPGGGTAHSIDGRFSQYQFPVMFDYWREAQVVVDFIASEIGGYDKLKDQTIVTLYHDSGYGRETIEPMRILSEMYGFKDVQIPVAHPGVQQNGQWQQIRQVGADWVFFRSWGAMTPVGIKTAKRFGFPVDRIIGDIWAGSEDDVRPAGDAAVGYRAVNIFPSGTDFELIQNIKEVLYDNGKGDLDDMSRFGTVYYNFGVIEALIYSEMLRVAHEKFGTRPITGEEASWAYENLDIDEERLAEIGAVGLLAPLKLTPCNHQGERIQAKVHQWDGEQFNASDWIEVDPELFRPHFMARAESYAAEKGLEPRDLDCST